MKITSVLLIAVMIAAAFPALGGVSGMYASAASVTASGKVSESDVNLRKSATTSSKSVASLRKDTKLTIHSEVFTKRGSTSAKNRWYYVTAGKNKGYIRADLVKYMSFGKTKAVTTDALNYRKGPATSFGKLGTAPFGTQMTLLLPAKFGSNKSNWYRVKINNKTAYLNAAYIRMGSSAFAVPSEAVLKGKSDLAKALLTNPTSGGKARVVYTFDKKNCKALFSISGYKNAKVPQGFTFTGSEYYILYGMAAGQSIVRYSAAGKRLGASKFSFCIGHPNGITWDPVTKMCYIFKGNQKKIYTWNPATDKFGKSKTPYSSSGVGYDKTTKLLYATSHTGIRAYSADGKFKHKKLFSRCSHGIFHYIQDCGAGEGYIFHGISGSNKKTTNYLDVYRASDYAYLGSVKIAMGEIESAVVGNDGFLQLLVNTPGNTDYVWRTPLNVKELKF